MVILARPKLIGHSPCLRLFVALIHSELGQVLFRARRLRLGREKFFALSFHGELGQVLFRARRLRLGRVKFSRKVFGAAGNPKVPKCLGAPFFFFSSVGARLSDVARMR